MTVLRVALVELKRLTSGVLPVLVLLAMSCIPLLYGALYLYGNWDAYGHVNGIVGALVVEDEGAMDSEGQQVNTGADVKKNLLDAGTFDWRQVQTRTEAVEGVENGTYDFAMVIPKDFSRNLQSAGSFKPDADGKTGTIDARSAGIEVITNDANNYVLTNIVTKAGTAVRDSVAEKVGNSTANSLLASFTTIHSKMGEAADGASKVNSGTVKLADAITQLKDGTATVNDGAVKLKNGTSSLADGQSQLLDGQKQLAEGAAKLADGVSTLDSGAAKLDSGASKLADGASSLKDGSSTLASAAASASDGAAKLKDGSATLAEGTASLKSGSAAVAKGANDLASGSATLADGNSKIASGASSLASGSATLSGGASELKEGTDSLKSGTAELKDGSGTLAEKEQSAVEGQQKLADGANELKDGASKLSDGTAKLSDGSTQLNDGASELKDGTSSLESGLASGVKQVPSLAPTDQAKVADTMSNPVTLSHDSLASGRNYGEGMGPFFMCLALWIGGLMLVQTLRVMNNRALASHAPSIRVMLGSWMPFGLVGIAQATLMFAAIKFGLGFEMAHPWLVWLFLCYVALVFTGFIHGLTVILGAPGKLVALVILILQLITAGGTMPYETLPESIRWMHDFFPMGYAVAGTRRLAYGINESSLWGIMLVLTLWGLAGLVLGYIGTRRNRTWSLKKLAPEITV